MTSKEMKWPARAVYALGKFLAIFLSTFVFPLKVTGRENIPKSGPFIVIANHISMLEIFFIPRLLLPHRAVFMAKNELFSHGKFISWVLRSGGAFPVRRGSADITAIKQSLEILKAGDVFAIFPEGTRNKKLDGALQKFLNGVGYIALLSGAPVLPVYFRDTAGYKPFRPAYAVIGKPVDMKDILADGGKISSEATALATQRALGALSAMM